MNKIVCAFNLTKFLVDADKALRLGKWGCKCKNKKTKERILKSCYKIIKNSKVDKNMLKIIVTHC